MTGAGLDVRAQVRVGTFDLDAAIAVEPGELLVLVGPNGAGKSTLLRAVMGLRAVDGGRITLAGETLDDPEADVFVPARRRAIGAVFQDRLLFEHLDVVENVAFGLRSRGTPRRAAREIAMQWLERFGLTALARSRPAQLSGGESQRVALARALAVEPRLLVLDEPFVGLDATTRVDVRRELRHHLAGVAAPRVLVTHDPIEALGLADRIVVLESGRVTQTGTPAEVAARPRSAYVADLLGVNLLHGTLRAATLELDGGHPVAVVNDDAITGPATAIITPRAVTVHTVRPQGSARNAWATTIADLDDQGERVRVRVGAPVPLSIDITPSARAELGLVPGAPVWISFKATDVAIAAE